MAKNTPHCIIEFKLYTEKWQADRIAHMFDYYERMYNIMIRYAKKQLATLRNNEEYKNLLFQYSELLKKSELSKTDKGLQKSLSKSLNEMVLEHGLSKCQFETYLKRTRIKSFGGKPHSAITQKVADAAWDAVEKVLYGNGKKLHFKKRGAMRSFEGKDNKTGIQFDKNTNRVKIGKMSFRNRVYKVWVEKHPKVTILIYRRTTHTLVCGEYQSFCGIRGIYGT